MVDANEKISLCNGELELFRIPPEAADEVVEFFYETFVKDEPMHKGLKLIDCDLYREKIGERVRKCLKDEVSFAVRHCATKKLAAIRINRFVTNAAEPDPVIKTKTPAIDFIVAFEKRMKECFNPFKEWKIDCVLEMSFLTTSKAFGGRGLGTKLSQHSIDFARAMLNGTLKGIESLPAHVRDLKPKAATSLYSSLYTQKMGAKLGMQIFARIPYTDLFFKGRPISEVVEPIHTSVTCVAIKL